MDREQAMNFQIQIDNIDREMNAINRLAKAYMNATPEQRANVNEGDMRAQIERYKELKNQKAVLQEQRAEAELIAARQAAEAEAARQAQLNTRGTWRRANNNNWNPNWYTLSDEQYAARLEELAREQAAQQPHAIFNNWDGTYYYSDWTTRYENWTIVRWESNNIEVRVAPSGAPYYYDKTTGNQAQQIWTDANGNALVMDSQWWVKTMYPIQNAINNQILADRRASDAARWYNNALVDQTVTEGQTALDAMAWATALYTPALPTATIPTTTRTIGELQAANLLWRSTAVPTSRAMTLASEWTIVNPTYGNALSNWAQRYLQTVEKTKNLANWFNTKGIIPNARKIMPVSEWTITYPSINWYTAQIARNYNPIMSNWNNIINSINASKSILPQWEIYNRWVQFVNNLLNGTRPFSL